MMHNIEPLHSSDRHRHRMDLMFEGTNIENDDRREPIADTYTFGGGQSDKTMSQTVSSTFASRAGASHTESSLFGGSVVQEDSQTTGLPTCEQLPAMPILATSFHTQNDPFSRTDKVHSLHQGPQNSVKSVSSGTDTCRKSSFMDISVQLRRASEGTNSKASTVGAVISPPSVAIWNRTEASSVFPDRLNGAFSTSKTLTSPVSDHPAKDSTIPVVLPKKVSAQATSASPSVIYNATSDIFRHASLPDDFHGDSARSTFPAVKRIRLSAKRNSLPLGLRNKKMQATDCLLFAATLLEEGESTVVDANDQQHHCSQGGTALNGNARRVHKQNPDSTYGVSAPSAVPPVTESFPETSLSASSGTNPNVASVGTTCSLSGTNSVAVSVGNISFGFDGSISPHSQSGPSEQPHVTESATVSEPNVVDVLMGRGGRVNNHPGNIIFRRVVEFNKAYYRSVHKRNRILVSQSIVQAVLNHGGRFLIMGKKGGKSWNQIDFKKAVQKTSQALREFKRSEDEKQSSSLPFDAGIPSQMSVVTSHELGGS